MTQPRQRLIDELSLHLGELMYDYEQTKDLRLRTRILSKVKAINTIVASEHEFVDNPKGWYAINNRNHQEMLDNVYKKVADLD